MEKRENAAAELTDDTGGADCDLECAVICQRRGCRVSGIHRRLCRSGGVAVVDRLYEGLEERVRLQTHERRERARQTRQRLRAAPSSGLGDRLHTIVTRETGAIPCGDCRNAILALNGMTRAELRSRAAEIAAGMVERAQTAAPRWWQRWGASAAPGRAAAMCANWIAEAIDGRHPRFVAAIRPAMRVARRIDARGEEGATWERTISSVVAAGFPAPLVYAEPDAPAAATAGRGGKRWSEVLGPIGSFKAMVADLLANTAEEWLLLLEDDVLLADHTADYLRRFNLTDEILSLYVSGPRQLPGFAWSTIKKPLVGSLAVVIRRRVLADLTKTRQWRRWSKRDCVDQLIHRAAAEAGVPVQTHNPALAQHIGETAAIYPDRTLAAPLRHAADWSQSGPWSPGLLTLITPTGDRPESFRRCERMIGRQRYTGPVQWIVIDDGREPTKTTAGQLYLRERPRRGHTLCRNLRAALPHIRGEKILVVEDDDWYSADYLSTMAGRLERADLVGETGAKYYYVRSGMWRHNHQSETHASLCRTGFTRAVLPTLARVIQGRTHPSVDLRLWRRWTGSRFTWTDPDGVCALCVGIKQLPGRPSRGHRPTRAARDDPGGVILERWTGAEAAEYAGFLEEKRGSSLGG